MSWLEILLTLLLLLTWGSFSVWQARKDKPAKRAPKPPKLSQEEDRIIAELVEAFDGSARTGLFGTIDLNGHAELLGTRLGGPLIFEKGQAIPVDDSGAELQQILLVRLSDLAGLDAQLTLPAEGWLQVLIGRDDLLGCAFPSVQGQGFRLIYYPAVTEFDHLEMQHSEGDYTIWYGPNLTLLETHGLPLTWAVKDHWPGPEHYQLSPKIDAAYKDASDAMRSVLNGLIDAFADRNEDYSLVLGGHAQFVQWDMRLDRDGFPGQWENFIGFSSRAEAMMWGDAGEATILLPNEDIAKMDYTRAKYSWDCG